MESDKDILELRNIVKEANDKVRNKEVDLSNAQKDDIENYYYPYFEKTKGFYGGFYRFMFLCFVDLAKEITVDKEPE